MHQRQGSDRRGCRIPRREARLSVRRTCPWPRGARGRRRPRPPAARPTPRCRASPRRQSVTAPGRVAGP